MNDRSTTITRLEALKKSRSIMDRLTEACDAVSDYLRGRGDHEVADAFDEVWMAEPDDDWE